TTPEVNGTFNDWCGGCAPMTDDDADNIWQITIDLEAGFYEYKYAADTWTIQESLTPGDPCTMTTDIFTNRTLDVSEDMVLEAVCWGSCEACETETTVYSVTFMVNMNEVSEDFTTPEVNGTFNDWCGGCAPMTDDDADNIWQITIDLEEGSYEYKFAADTWTIQESLTPGDPCTVTADIFTNRQLDVFEDIVLNAVCWGSCEACDTTGGPTSSSLFELNDQVQLLPSVVDDGFVLSGLTQTYSFSITDLNGRLMDRYRNVPAGQKIMTDTYAPGLYILILTSETGEVIAMKKFFKE
ncbi:MAG TPA: T9SS type A sorting domain-containing protein, partial [Chitinophagales bacterium]|nr:T9SS type A sorting domain-containing protein [Chitinophagales bacterium]